MLPLYERLSQAEQEQIFHPRGNARRIVLATNVAETSLTVPGIRFVVDSGLARVKRYSWRNKVEQLRIEPISRASANQRAGRCGRIGPGLCIRLFDEADFNARAAFTAVSYTHLDVYKRQFLPTESLYAEVLRRPGLLDRLHDLRINVAGPSNLAALLNSLQMGFRTLAIEQRSSEVWQVPVSYTHLDVYKRQVQP